MGTQHHQLEQNIVDSKSLAPGAQHYRAFVGPPAEYDFMGATQFRLATALGLREEHYLLDLGCGSLRAGKFMVQYLLPGRYFGIEPNAWLWQSAINNEIGQDIFNIKKPTFSAVESFDANVFGITFDFIVAQSIFSHTGVSLLKSALESGSAALKPRGQFLFTALTEGTPGFGILPRGDDTDGWVYPGCLTYSEREIKEYCSSFGLCVQRLNWFHPRQRWYRAVLREDHLIEDAARDLGAGRVLFDDRF